MIDYPFGSLVTGLCLVGASAMALGRHALLEPVSGNYPKAPGWVRHSMFGMATILMFVGLQYLWVFVSGKPNTIPPQPPGSMQLLAIALFIHKAAMLLNILRQRCPEQVWDRLNRINQHLHCKDVGPFWKWLSH